MTKFLNVKTLSLCKCPVWDIIDIFHSLIELELRECSLLVQSMSLLDHVLDEIMFPLSSLQQLTIDEFSSLTSFSIDGRQFTKTLKVLIISNCENLEFLSHEYLHNYTLLKEYEIVYLLRVINTWNVKSILIEEDVSQNKLLFFRSIKIWDCSELESFPHVDCPL